MMYSFYYLRKSYVQIFSIPGDTFHRGLNRIVWRYMVELCLTGPVAWRDQVFCGVFTLHSAIEVDMMCLQVRFND